MGHPLVEFSDVGVENAPLYFAEKCTNQLVIRASQEQFPEHVQVQFRQRYKVVRDVIEQNIRRAINSDRYALAQQLRIRGLSEAADFVLTEKVTR